MYGVAGLISAYGQAEAQKAAGIQQQTAYLLQARDSLAIAGVRAEMDTLYSSIQAGRTLKKAEIEAQNYILMHIRHVKFCEWKNAEPFIFNRLIMLFDQLITLGKIDKVILVGNDDHDQTKKPFALRSQRWFDDKTDPGMTSLYCERMLNFGLTWDELQSGRPILGISQTGSDITPCNRHHTILSQRVKEGIRDAGGVPLEFPIHQIQETLKRPTAALDRNLQYLSLVEILHGYPPLVDSGNGITSQAEHSVLVAEKPIVLTSAPPPPPPAAGTSRMSVIRPCWSTVICGMLVASP
jgi:hypothetical protein